MRQPSKGISLECIESNAAGIDVGATEIYVALPPDRDPQPVRRFKTFTEDLRQMAGWLTRCGISTVAMESTGVSWLPPYEILESAGIRVCLVNSKHVKHVPGRKSDVQDCQWLQYLHSVGLLHASFRPDDKICAIRSLSRHRASLIESAAVHVQHMHKALTQMNLQIHHVLSDITGLSGMAIIEAIVTGERSPAKLAVLCQQGVRSSRETVMKSLVGNYRSEHLFTLKQSLTAYRHYQELMAECDREIERLMALLDSKIDPPGKDPMPPANPGRHKRRKNQFHFEMRSELNRVFGVDRPPSPASARSPRIPCWPRSDPTSAASLRLRPSPVGLPCARPTRRAVARCCRPRPARPTAVPAAPCASPPRPWPVRAHIWVTITAVCEPDWERPRPSPPQPTNWPASSTTC
jgi:hypothetical protein